MRILVIFWIVGLAVLSALASAGTVFHRTTTEGGAPFAVTLDDGRVLRAPL